MKVILYDKTPVIGAILKDWVNSVLNGSSDIEYSANLSDLHNFAANYSADIAIVDIDYPVDKIYELIEKLYQSNTGTQFLFTTFSIASNFDFSRITTKKYMLFQKSSGYFEFCSNLRSVIKVLDTCE